MIRLQTRYHFYATLKYIKIGLVICIVPLIQAFIDFNLQALFVALKQDAFIAVLIVGIAFIIWRNSLFTLYQNNFVSKNGVLFKNSHCYNLSLVTVIELKRNILQRILGASQVTIYFKSSYHKKKVVLFLPKAKAEQFLDIVMPVSENNAQYQPTGWHKLILVMLSANIITTGFFVYFSIKNISNFIGQDIGQLAYKQITQLDKFFSFILPTGVSMLFTLIFCFTLLSLIFSFFNTYGFSVARQNNVILSKGGFITKRQTRIFANCVTASDIRISPFARLLRCYPVFVSAGCYTCEDMPLIVYKKGDTKHIRKILPEFTIAKNLHTGNKNRSFIYFSYKPLILCGLFTVMIILAIKNAPDVVFLLSLVLAISFLFLWFCVFAFFKEGFGYAKNRTLCVEYNRNFTFHKVCIYTNDISYTITQSSFSAGQGLCNLTINTPGPKSFFIRSVAHHVVNDLRLFL